MSNLDLTGRDFWDAAIIMTPAASLVHSAASLTSPYAASSADITLMVATCNDEENILATLDTIREAMGVIGKSYEIIVIDNGSKDHTIDIVRGYMTEFSNFNIVLRINKKPKGEYANYVDGAFIGSGKYYRMVYGDNSESVETMIDTLRALGEADILIPYYISMRRKSLWERLKKGSFTWAINIVAGKRVNLYSGLHVHLRYNVLRFRSSSAGAFFQTDLLCQLMDLGFTYKQVPARDVPTRARFGFCTKIKRTLSGFHTLLELFIRRISNHLHAQGD